MPNITKGFMHLMKKETSFPCDETTQQAFKEFKKALLLAPFLHPQDYTKYFVLYLDAFESIIGVVIVQEYDKI